MRDRTQINLNVIDKDDFLEMPLETQALYFHLVFRADSNGVLNNYKAVMRLVRGRESSFEMLVKKGYVGKTVADEYYIADWEKHIG